VTRSGGSLVDDLCAALAPERVLTRPLELALYSRDASVIKGRAEVVCLPESTAASLPTSPR
jgi:FAD/FMN-containing dehydrogenase